MQRHGFQARGKRTNLALKQRLYKLRASFLQAYNPATQRIAMLYDFLFHGEAQPLHAVDLERPSRTVTSTFVKVANEAEPLMKDTGVDIPLFW